MVNKNNVDAEKLKELKKWFIENPKLPPEIDNILLKRFLKCVLNDIDEAKRLIKHNYTIRNDNPHMFIDRDPCDETLKEFHELHDVIPLPGLTPEGCRILFFRLNECEPSKMNSLLESKVFYMMADSRFTMLDAENADKEINEADECNDDNLLANGDVQILDIGNYTLSHLARISIFTVRTHMKFLQEAYPVRLKATHIINCPPYIDKMITIMRPFIRDEVYKMTHFHTEGMESLYKHVPQNMLPNEYGGKAGSIAELKSKWVDVLQDKRDYLMDPNQWKAEQIRSRWSWW